MAFALPRFGSRSVLLFSAAALILIYAIYHPGLFSLPLSPPPILDPSAFFLSLSARANYSIARDLRSLTSRPHLAGTAGADTSAAYVLARLKDAGLDTFTRNYTVLLSYPLSSSLSVRDSDGSVLRLSLAGDAPGVGVVPPYHAYAPSGAAVAPAVYVNYGREEDYESLEKHGVSIDGCIAIARRGSGEYRGAIVERAAAKGAVAVLVAGDPGAGVERGTVLLQGLGDPVTPGWPAIDGEERLKMEDVKLRFPRIPSMPVLAETAEAILRLLNGPPPPSPEWKAGVGTVVSGVGPGPAMINFTYQEEKKFAAIQNIFAVIQGRQDPDRYIILGNHRDAWTYGAVDPNSGTSALLDVARRFGAMLLSGWRPLRTIILCSWDAEEFGMVGSTEWVEENFGNLYSKAIAYLNVDCAVQGPGLFASATPQLDEILIDITKQVKDPDVQGMTIHQTSVKSDEGINIEWLARADSDFSPFLHQVGIPSVDLYYGKEFSGYHTAFDTFSWMESQGDPTFHRHTAIAELWGLLGLRLADEFVIPFDFESYAIKLQARAKEVAALIGKEYSLEPIVSALRLFSDAASKASEEGKSLREQAVLQKSVTREGRSFNDRMLFVERSFLDAEGLVGRPWFKHLLSTPHEGRLASFPGIANAIEQSRELQRKDGHSAVRHEIFRVARAIRNAAVILGGRTPYAQRY